MSTEINDNNHNRENLSDQSRRNFLSTLGAGALGMSMLSAVGNGGGMAFASGNQPDDKDLTSQDWENVYYGDQLEKPAMPCSFHLWSTDRQAQNIQNINVINCDPCDCFPHTNTVSALNIMTAFKPNSACDELASTPIDIIKIRWLIRNRFVREPGPCNQLPVGVFDGIWYGIDAGNNTIVKGQLTGTLGYDPSLAVGSTRCCSYPLIVGAMVGNGIAGTPAGGAIFRWTFIGREGNAVCDPTNWNVGITGIVRIPC